MFTTERVLVGALVVSMPFRLASAQLPAGTVPPSPEALAARLDSIVKTDILPRGFASVSIAVTRGGQTVLERAWGFANVAKGEKADPSTVYRIGSVTKQFTAALVLKLVDRGKLSVSDSIGRYLAGLRPEWKGITIDQLLNHTSGLQRDFQDISRITEKMTGEQLIALAARDTMAFKPGTSNAYSNTGYMLLGNLVEKLYGKPYGVVLRDEIARPLQLTELGYCETMSTTRAAEGYIRLSDGKQGPPNESHLSQSLGAGGICATARDMAKWNQALHGGRVLSAKSYAEMTTPRPVAKGYGFGLSMRNSFWGTPAIVHDGQTQGFSSHNGYYPADSLSVTLLYNSRPRLEIQMADFVGMLAVGGTPRPIPPIPVIDLPVAATQGGGRPKFVGAYELSQGRVFIVTFENGNLHVTPPGGGTKQQLYSKSGLVYTLGSPESTTTVTFQVDSEGDVTGFVARQNGIDRALPKVK